MSSSLPKTTGTNPIARRCLVILQQMTEQLLGHRRLGALDQQRLERIKADMTKLVHWALHDQGQPEIVSRIRDCYRRCDLDIDDTRVLRQVRGVVKGELRKAGIDTLVPGLDPALDAPTIILTTKRTVQRLGGAGSSSSLTKPGPALDPKPAKAVDPPKPPAAAEPPPAQPHTLRRARATTTTQRKTVTPAEMRAAFDRIVGQTLALVQRSAPNVTLSDYLAIVYNDDAKKSKLVEQMTASLPAVDHVVLVQTIDGFFRAGFKGAYIERTDRRGNRRAHKR
jgi:hypothetical protein